jgi:nitrite reductase/ring-hydroxylating ferredoxin subunit
MRSSVNARVLCRLEDIPDGDCAEVEVDGRDLVLARSGTQVWAYVNVCPHFSLPLNSQPNEFLIAGERRVMCAFHCAIFRFEDGRCVEGPAEGMGLEPVSVAVVSGHVVLGATRDDAELPESAGDSLASKPA